MNWDASRWIMSNMLYCGLGSHWMMHYLLCIWHGWWMKQALRDIWREEWMHDLHQEHIDTMIWRFGQQKGWTTLAGYQSSDKRWWYFTFQWCLNTTWAWWEDWLSASWSIQVDENGELHGWIQKRISFYGCPNVFIDSTLLTDNRPHLMQQGHSGSHGWPTWNRFICRHVIKMFISQQWGIHKLTIYFIQWLDVGFITVMVGFWWYIMDWQHGKGIVRAIIWW